MGFNPYQLLIVLSSLVILSYIFNLIAKRYNIPSVVLLIGTGVALKYALDYFNSAFEGTNWFSILNILGIVGLIMIVLEAALDLELTKEKWPIIWKSFLVALAGLFLTSAIYAGLIAYFMACPLNSAIIYSIPLSILSSAIVIPSVMNCREDHKEFMIYESTFSDILGIMVFYFFIEGIEAPPDKSLFLSISLNIIFTFVISILLGYVLTIVFQNIKSKTKLFLLISVLILLYDVGKLMHLSSLLIILFFGLVINNHKLFFRGALDKFIHEENVLSTLSSFKIITLETAFIVRTFFFVVFGLSISIASLINLQVLLISLIFIGTIYILRYVVFVIFAKDFLLPALFVSPRGLITILLFFAIPDHMKILNFDNGILLYMILISSGVMTLILIGSDKEEKLPGILKVTSRILKGGDSYSSEKNEDEGPEINH